LHKLIVMSKQFLEQKTVGINIPFMLHKVIMEIVSCTTRTHWKHYLLCFHHLVVKRTLKLHQAMVFTKVFIIPQILACSGYKCKYFFRIVCTQKGALSWLGNLLTWCFEMTISIRGWQM
jgi:hypothetical protein